MHLVTQALNGLDIFVDATIYQESESLSCEVSSSLKIVECVERQKVLEIVIMGQLLDLLYEVIGGLQMLRIHLLCLSYIMRINKYLVSSKARLDFLSSTI